MSLWRGHLAQHIKGLQEGPLYPYIDLRHILQLRGIGFGLGYSLKTQSPIGPENMDWLNVCFKFFRGEVRSVLFSDSRSRFL